MIKFERYSHINDLIEHYIKTFEDKTMEKIMEKGVASESDAVVFSTFVWKIVEQINEDEENGVVVLGGADNTEMLPDLNYEVSQYMKQVGFHSTWEKVSRSNFSD